MGRQRVVWFGLDVVCRRTPLSGVGVGGGGHHYSITINIPTKFRTCERGRRGRRGSLLRPPPRPGPVRGLQEGPPQQLLIVMPRNRASGDRK